MALGGTNFKMRSSTSLDPYASAKFTAGEDYTAGQMIKLEDTVGVIVNTVSEDYLAVLVYRATRILVPCAVVTSGNVADYAIFCKVYYSAGGAEVTTVASGHTLCGTVHETPSVGDETVLIDLDGRLGIVS